MILFYDIDMMRLLYNIDMMKLFSGFDYDDATRWLIEIHILYDDYDDDMR